MTEALANFKYFIFFTIFFTGIPIGFHLAKIYPKIEKYILFGALFFTCQMEDINFFSQETYRGSSRGFEIGLVDIVTFILFFLILHKKKQFPIQLFPAGSFLYFAYFFGSLLSLMNSHLLLHSSFELFKMLRMYFYFWVIANYLNNIKQFDTIIKFIAIIIIYCFFSVLNQKYRLGIFQAQGPFPHQNSLVMYMIIFGSITYSYLLNFPKAKIILWFPIFGMVSIIIISTLSRAGMTFFALSIAIVTFISFIRKFSFKKVTVTFLLFLCGSLGLLKALDSILERFNTAPEESKLTRIYLAQAAVNMANAKTFGIGINNFGLKINPPFPYGSHIKRKSDDEKGGLVETIYLMIAAETGWFNLSIFLMMLLTFYFKNIINIFYYSNSKYKFLPIGITGGLTGIYVESTLEWVLKQTNNFYQLMLIFAFISVMSKLHKSKPTRKRI